MAALQDLCFEDQINNSGKVEAANQDDQRQQDPNQEGDRIIMNEQQRQMLQQLLQ